MKALGEDCAFRDKDSVLNKLFSTTALSTMLSQPK